MTTPGRALLESLGRALSPEAEQALNGALESARLRYDIRAAAASSRGPIVRDLDKATAQAKRLAKTLRSATIVDRLEEARDLAEALERLAATAQAEAAPIRDYTPPTADSLDGTLADALGQLLGHDLVGVVSRHLNLKVAFSRSDTGEPAGPFIDAMKAAAAAIGVRTTPHTIGSYVSAARLKEGVGSIAQNSCTIQSSRP